jgi:hypothetical protein
MTAAAAPELRQRLRIGLSGGALVLAAAAANRHPPARRSPARGSRPGRAKNGQPDYICQRRLRCRRAATT